MRTQVGFCDRLTSRPGVSQVDWRPGGEVASRPTNTVRNNMCTVIAVCVSLAFQPEDPPRPALQCPGQTQAARSKAASTTSMVRWSYVARVKKFTHLFIAGIPLDLRRHVPSDLPDRCTRAPRLIVLLTPPLSSPLTPL